MKVLPKYKDNRDFFDDVADFVILHEGFEENKSGKDLVAGARWIGSGIEELKYLDQFDKTGKWTAADNRKAVKEILNTYTPYLKKTFGSVWPKLSPDKKLVLYDAAYNIGINALTEKSPKFVKAVLSGDDDAAMREMNWGNHQAKGLRTRNANRQARWAGGPFKPAPIRITRTYDGNKIMNIDPSYYELVGILKPVLKELPAEGLIAQATPTKSITELKPILPPPSNSTQQVLNQGIDVTPARSPFDLNLDPPPIESLFHLNSPEEQLKQYIASTLEVPLVLLDMPMLQPLGRFKCGKLPRYADGDTPIEGGIPFAVTVTGRDRRPAWRKMYENPNLTSERDLINIAAEEEFKKRHPYGPNSKPVEPGLLIVSPEFDLISLGNGIKDQILKLKSSGGIQMNPVSRDGMFRYDYLDGSGNSIGRINFTTFDNHPHITFLKSSKPGTGRKLYDAAIQHVRDNNMPGIYSGENLLSAPKTYSTWEHYPNRIFVGNYGTHSNFNMPGIKQISRGSGSKEQVLKNWANNKFDVYDTGDVYLLTEPSEPVKYFTPFSIDIPSAMSHGSNVVLNHTREGYKNGKSPIHIKPGNRGKLTRLKKRTGKSESELYNDGNPAHRKMVVFARNARKWKH